jgi:hypothetical protein
MRKSNQDDFMRFPDRRSWYIFLARMAVLLVATGALLGYGLSQALPGTTRPPTLALIATPARTPGPELSASLSAGLDATGALTEDVQVVSQDGLAVLSLPRGTKVLDAQGQPLASITVTFADILSVSATFARVGEGYKFGPEGATLDPPASLTINYNPHATFPFDFVNDVEIGQVYLTYWGKKGPIRPSLAMVDGETGSISAKIDHLGTMVLFCDVHYYPLS